MDFFKFTVLLVQYVHKRGVALVRGIFKFQVAVFLGNSWIASFVYQQMQSSEKSTKISIILAHMF